MCSPDGIHLDLPRFRTQAQICLEEGVRLRWSSDGSPEFDCEGPNATTCSLSPLHESIVGGYEQRRDVPCYFHSSTHRCSSLTPSETLHHRRACHNLCKDYGPMPHRVEATDPSVASNVVLRREHVGGPLRSCENLQHIGDLGRRGCRTHIATERPTCKETFSGASCPANTLLVVDATLQNR